MVKMKKGYLLVEFSIYLALVSVLLVLVLNVSLFFFKEYKKELDKCENLSKVIEIDNYLSSLIDAKGTVINFEGEKIIVDKVASENIQEISADKNGLVIRTKKKPSTYIKAVTLDESVTAFNIEEDGNLFFMNLKFNDGYEASLIYEK